MLTLADITEIERKRRAVLNKVRSGRAKDGRTQSAWESDLLDSIKGLTKEDLLSMARDHLITPVGRENKRLYLLYRERGS